MVILQWRYVVVANSQFCLGVNLVNVVVAGMIEIVTNAGGEKYEDFKVADLGR